MTDSVVIVDKGPGGVATLVFNRPDKLNAFTADLVAEATAAMAELRDDAAVRSVVVRGNGRAFSAGFDLGTARPDAQSTPPAKLRRWKFGQEGAANLLGAFWRFPKPVVAAVHGYCLGGACELALLCDLTIAAESCQLGEPEIRQGTSSANSVLLALFVPPKIAAELLLGGGLMTAARAYQVGLVNQVVPDDELLEAAGGPVCSPCSTRTRCCSRKSRSGSRLRTPAPCWQCSTTAISTPSLPALSARRMRTMSGSRLTRVSARH